MIFFQFVSFNGYKYIAASIRMFDADGLKLKLFETSTSFVQTITRLIIIPIIIITGAWFELCNFSTNGRERKTGGCVVRYVMHFVFKLLCMMIWWSFLMDIYQKYHNGSWNRTYPLSLFFEKYLRRKSFNRCLTPLCYVEQIHFFIWFWKIY